MGRSLDNSLDTVLGQLGDLGKYQSFVFSLVCCAVVLHSAVHVAFVFTAMDLEYRCEVPGCDNDNASSTEYSPDWLKHAAPFENRKPEKCDMFYHNYSSDSEGKCAAQNFNQKQVQHCSSFVYKTKEVSIVKEYNLHCKENLWKITMVGTINNVGQFFGSFISGLLSDKYGRKVVLVWGMVFCGTCGILRTFMPTYELFLLFEFLDAAFGSGTYICGFILGVEFVRPKHRILTGTIVSSCYAVGEVFTAGSAWLVESWKPLTYILYTPGLLLLSYLWLIPESVRWSLSNGRSEEAKIILRRVATVNGKTISEDTLEKLGGENQYDEPQNPFTEVFKSTPLMLRLINCCFCWITCTFLFYGLTLHSVTLAGNSYLDFILTALVEIPALFACAYVVEKYGRKNSLVVSYLLTGAACVGFIFIPSDSEWGSLCVYLLGKFGATAAFTILYILTSEMFPTTMRHSFMGICSTLGRVGSMISPQTPLLAQIWTPLPLVSFAGMSIIAGFLSLLFPETLNKKLPDTIEEAVNIGRNSGKDAKNQLI